MSRRRIVFGLIAAGLLAACDSEPGGAVGQLVSDRIEVTVEKSEPIVAILVSEGQQVESGQVLVVQNDERVQARLAEVTAAIRQTEALLAEQQQGPRQETIAAARALVQERLVEFQYRSTELQRVTGLRNSNLTSAESEDLARKLSDSAGASLAAARAQLAELEAGTRPEQLEQSRASLQQAQARLTQLQIEQQRHTLRATTPAVVDSLPFEVGERPPVGSVVAVLLSGSQPHARVYVPEPYRVDVAPGDPARVRVDGLDAELSGTVRRIASEASFTPYFALTEEDRSRLSYVAEITLPALPRRLPDGVPVEVFFDSIEQAGDDE